MLDFFCNKRYDISFSDLHRLIKVVLPSDYTSRETRGIYRRDYMPCNIIALKRINTDEPELNIYCWLGQKGLTVLADNEFSVSLCIEVLKNVQQNAEDYKVLSFNLVDKTELLKILETNNLLIYQQLNSSDNTDKYIIREYNGDEVLLDFYKEPDMIRLSGALTSLFTFVQLSIDKLSK